MPRIQGRLGSASIANANATTVHTVPAGHEAACNVTITATGGSAAKVHLAFSTNAAPGAADWVGYDLAIEPGESYLRTGELLAAGERVIVQRVSGGTIAVDVRGVQEPVI